MRIYSPYLSNLDPGPKHHHDDGSPIERELYKHYLALVHQLCSASRSYVERLQTWAT